MPNTLLIVCTANVCRSRLAAAVIDARKPQGWIVTSAGTHARDGDAGCSKAASRQQLVLARGARHVRAADVERADLVLTAEREHRSAVTRLVPSARMRTFTLKEFDLLAEQFGFGPEESRHDGDGVRRALAGLDRRRPMLTIPTVTFGLRHRLGQIAVDPGRSLDIEDGHRLTAARHRRTLDDIETVSARIAALLDQRVRGPVVAPPATTLFGRGRHRDGSGDRWHNRRSRGAAGRPGGD